MAKKIWIDMDNSPHVVFFNPIIKTLESMGYEIEITARDCFQVCGLADLLDIHYKRIGIHYGRHKILKIVGTIIRSLQLLPNTFKNKPVLAISHGSRSQIMTAWILRIPVIVIFDYEYTQSMWFMEPKWKMAPDVVVEYKRKNNISDILTYPGIKEDVYVPDFKPDKSILKELGLNENDIIVTIRPPATEAHYHNPESEILFAEVINIIGENPETRMVILPRNEIKQTKWIRDKWSEWCSNGKIIIPIHVVDGLNMIWHSDFVISGGGTMNREAAALNIPVYTIFRGKIGAVDRYLSENGRLVILESVKDVREKIKVVHRQKGEGAINRNSASLEAIIQHIENIIGEKR